MLEPLKNILRGRGGAPAGGPVYIEEYLQDLRRDRFAPRAIAHYVRRAFARAREGMIANPGAARSIWSLGLVFFALCFVGSAATILSKCPDKLFSLPGSAGVAPFSV